MNILKTKVGKRLLLGILTVVILGVAGSATNASAQDAAAFEIQVPFEFVIMGRTYPAAKYKLARLNPANPDLLVLKSSEGKILLIFTTLKVSSTAPAEFSGLTFKQTGASHILASVRAPGRSYENRLPNTKSKPRRTTTAQAVRLGADY